MVYQIHIEARKTRLFTDMHSHIRIPYRTLKEMRRLYPDGDFVIIGEIGCMARTAAEGDRLCLEDGREIPILPRGSFKWPFERIIGYAEVQEKYYVATIGGFFHLLINLIYAISKMVKRAGRCS